jgi:glycopeptide antibiotics resistance protein
MSNEGVTLISRAALVVALIIVTAFVRVLVGRSRRRAVHMGMGTLGGISAGVAVASLLSRWITTDISVICACLGIIAGWGVAWLFARRIPREAH